LAEVKPGETLLTRIFSLAMSSAIDFVSMLMAPFEAAYVHLKRHVFF
jgi:hypothetical protein